MDGSTITAIGSVIVGLSAAIYSYLSVRSNNKKELTISDRQQLSQEQADLRKMDDG